MKVILSRKGFDSQYGGYPSPILPDGKMISLPIPGKSSLRYSDLKVNDMLTYYDLIQQLGIRTVNEQTTCHVDPDICHEILDRPIGWKPAFGQVDAAEGHLRNQGVNEGDLFIFFGRFCKTKYNDEKYAFCPDKNHDFHALFGYLQIGRILRNNNFPSWLNTHPHANEEHLSNPTNTIYVASDQLSWDSHIPGAGKFIFNHELQLTRNNTKNISEWNLPVDIFRDAQISYHPNPWKNGFFKSADKGQEFVIQDNDTVVEWAKNIISGGIEYNL